MPDLFPMFTPPPDPEPWTPSSPGRGPGRLRDWYTVKMVDDSDFEGRYIAVDYTDPDKANHVLTFELENGTIRKVLYGEVLDCLPKNPERRRHVVSARRRKGTRI